MSARRAPWVLLLALLLVAQGCTFEERGNGGGETVGTEESSEEVRNGIQEVEDPEAAALNVVRTFRDGAATGDLSAALMLIHRNAILADELAGSTDEERTRGELLLEARARLSEGLRLRESSSRVTLSDGVAVVLSRLTVEPLEGEEALLDANFPVELLETVVLVPGDEGWRILHLHRSGVDPTH